MKSSLNAEDSPSVSNQSKKQTNSATALLMSQAAPVSIEVAKTLLQHHYGLEGNVKKLPGERDQNFLINTLDGCRLLFKIAHPAENSDVTDLQAAVLLHLERVAPELPTQRILLSKDGNPIERGLINDGSIRAVRLATFVDGMMLNDAPPSPELHRNLGSMLARVGLALKTFEHRAAHFPLSWDIQHSASLLELLPSVREPLLREQLRQILTRFSEEIGPYMSSFRKQVVHNDFSADNVLVLKDRPTEVCGVLDFGDMAHTPLVNDIAVAAAYLLNDSVQILEQAATLIGGYNAVAAITQDEQSLLFDLIATRMAMRIAITEARAIEFPENRSYILRNTPKARAQLATLLSLDRKLATQTLLQHC